MLTYVLTLSLHDALPIWPVRHHGAFDDAGGQHRPAGLRPGLCGAVAAPLGLRSEEHTSELQSLMRISYAVVCLKNTNNKTPNEPQTTAPNIPTQLTTHIYIHTRVASTCEHITIIY